MPNGLSKKKRELQQKASKKKPGSPAKGVKQSCPLSSIRKMEKVRERLKLPKAGSHDDVSTVAILKINGKEYQGVNSKNQNPKTKITLVRVNAQTKTHAEAEAVQKAINDGAAGTAEEAELHVDRDPCRACGPAGGLRSLARNLGVKRLVVHSPSGTQTFEPTA
ncbi:MAG: deaminase [Candidatus Contendobacter sp.]|nr:deaminase [Candidatus Contendobacter sp.]